MVTLTQTAPIADNAEFPLQAPLLQRIIGCVLIGVAIAAIPLMLTGNWFPSAILLLSEVAMLLALLALKRNNPRLAGWLILSTLTVCVAILLVAGKGPLDESVLAVPGLMIFASLFCSRRIYLSLLLFVATLLVGVGVLHFMGWRVIPVARVRPDTFISVIVILSITSYFV
jgi:diguanylate cyclase